MHKVAIDSTTCNYRTPRNPATLNLRSGGWMPQDTCRAYAFIIFACLHAGKKDGYTNIKGADN